MHKTFRYSLNLLAAACLLFSVAVHAKRNKKAHYNTIFAHGIADSKKQADVYFNELMLPTCAYTSFNFPDATFKFQHTSLGQDNEIERLANVYEHCVEYAYKEGKKPRFTLYGMSRGASVILNFVGKKKPNYVQALVLESPFYSIETIIIQTLKNLGITPSGSAIARGHSWVSFIFRSYRATGCAPCDILESIPKDLPILIICSKQDQRVPCHSSVHVYKKLVELGHKNVHLLTINVGKHAKILWGSEREMYRNCVHAFYKKYNIPHNAEYADLGASILQTTQPSSLLISV